MVITTQSDGYTINLQCSEDYETYSVVDENGKEVAHIDVPSKVWLVNALPWQRTYLYTSEEAALKEADALIERAKKGKEDDVECVTVDVGHVNGHNEVEELFAHSLYEDGEKL